MKHENDGFGRTMERTESKRLMLENERERGEEMDVLVSVNGVSKRVSEE